MELLQTAATEAIKFEGVQGALMLMGIGMFTVFLVLVLVIQIGKLLISLVNRFIPEEETTNAATPSETASKIDPVTANVIAKAIHELTNGKGKIESITRL